MNKFENLNPSNKYITGNPDKRSVSFKMTDSELYMIRENNIKRIHEILKNSYTAKPNEECNVRHIK